MRINNPKHLEPGLTPISRQKWLQVYFLSQVRRLDGDLNRADHWGWLSGHRDRGLSNKILIARAANFDKYYLLPCPGDGWRCYAIIAAVKTVMNHSTRRCATDFNGQVAGRVKADRLGININAIHLRQTCATAGR